MKGFPSYQKPMPKASLIMICTAFVATLAFGQNRDIPRAQNNSMRSEGGIQFEHPNGRLWNRLSPEAKVGLLIGMESGAVGAIQDLVAASYPDKGAGRAGEPLSATLTLAGLPTEKLMHQIDDFYAYRECSGIPIYEARTHVLRRLRGGEDPVTLDRVRAALCRKYSGW